MTLPQNCKSSVIPLFGQNTDRSSVPAGICTAVARSGGPRRRASASPLAAASTMAALRSLGTMLCIVLAADKGEALARRPDRRPGPTLRATAVQVLAGTEEWSVF